MNIETQPPSEGASCSMKHLQQFCSMMHLSS